MDSLSWRSGVLLLTEVLSIGGLALIAFGVLWSLISPRGKSLRRALVTAGLVLLALCFLAGAVAGTVAYYVARGHGGQ